MAKRTGVPTLIHIADRLCSLIVAFSPIIQRTYPDNVALQTALSTAMAACSVLRSELEDVREYGD